MPYTKIINLRTWTSVDNIYSYLQSPEHPNHLEYLIEPMQSGRPELPPQKLLPAVRKAIEKIIRAKSPGRPITNLFNLHIVRVPDYTWLTREERQEFAALYVWDVAPEGLSCHCWHHNRVTGAADLNVLSANLIDLERPRARRRSDSSDIADARSAADQITEVLNEKRRKQNRPLIVTMPERQQQIAAEKRGTSLEQELAQRATPTTLSNLKEAIEELGHEVVRFNPSIDYISIRFRSTKDALTPTTTRRGKRFQITWLLRQIPRKGGRRPPLGDSGFATPRDTDLNRMIGEWNLSEM